MYMIQVMVTVYNDIVLYRSIWHSASLVETKPELAGDFPHFRERL